MSTSLPNSDNHTALHKARQLDAEDALKAFRDRFLLPEKNGRQQVYFLGNSLGMQPRKTAEEIRSLLEAWSANGVESFFMGEDPWLHYHDHLTAPLARIVGAQPAEIVVMNSLTVNLHLMMASFYRPQGKRKKILCEYKAFPSDQYMLETHVQQRGFDPREVIVEVMPRDGEEIIREEDIQAAIDLHRDEIALVLFSGVNYYTGQCFDLNAITAAAHRAGALAGYDLAHAAGNVPLSLHEWDVDFACWCNYKYLNAGPGAVGGVFIHEKHHAGALPRFAGWWGHDKESRFSMQPGFVPIPSAEGWQLSTPPMLLLASMRASLEIFEAAGIDQLHHKRDQMTAYLWEQLQEVRGGTGPGHFRILTPEDPQRRGCQVSLYFPHSGRKVFDHLTSKGFFVDWREPGVIRLAPVPLYNTFEEIFLFGEALRESIEMARSELV